MARETTGSNRNEVSVTLLSVKLNLPECNTLKEKRNRLKSLISLLQRGFNVSVAETGLQDFHKTAWISCALVSNDSRHNTRIAYELLSFIENRFPDLLIEEHHIEQR
jgi:uncharacterized protein YlxP (DUF503 family)